MSNNIFSFQYILLAVFSTTALISAASGDPTRADYTVQKLAEGFLFAEGPAVAADGDLYFSDDPIFLNDKGGRIYRWSPKTNAVSIFVEPSNYVNGMCFDRDGKLLACEGGGGCVVSYDKEGNRTVLASTFGGKRFNMPNDLWIDPKGGVYFTDPLYGNKLQVVQDGKNVYYISPDRTNVVKVVDDMVSPNGLVGTPDGKLLYITDEGAGKVWRYKIGKNGFLSDKTLFAEEGIDGMTLDHSGNVYITTDDVVVFSPNGREIRRYKIPERPSNICFDPKDKDILYVTAPKSIYRLRIDHPQPPSKNDKTGQVDVQSTEPAVGDCFRTLLDQQ